MSTDPRPDQPQPTDAPLTADGDSPAPTLKPASPAAPRSPATQYDHDVALRSGSTIGHYKVLQLLGEGGFGMVYLAEQTEPVRRRVALKIIKPGMDSRAIVARFEAERQALALMSHQNIATVLDAGTTPMDAAGGMGGRPYFAMEHVKGEPITVYCDKHRLSVEQRLKLFAIVCEAVQHAHTKGIIHRDLKPSNILVTIEGGSEARPVIIDFGVAKALAGRLSEQTIYTEVGQLIGTPEYMSPEQAERSEADIDTRSDVYSLGVILYELLTGVVPFDTKTLRAAGVAAIQKVLREVDPPRPSTKLSQAGEANTAIATARHMRLDELAAKLRRELEWIPLKALRKDRSERYRSAIELADDVRNYLAQKPLIAGPESAGYKLRKFVRRNKGAVVAIAAIAGILLVATAAVVVFAVETGRQAAKTEVARAEVADAMAFNACAAYFADDLIVTVNSQLTAAAMRHMSRLPGIRKLRVNDSFGGSLLDETGVFETLRVLARPDSGLTALTAINLAYTKVGDAGVAALAAKESGLIALTSLDLSSTKVSDAGVAALAAKDSGLKAIEWLSLDGTKITDAGAVVLAAKDSGLTALSVLGLTNTQVTDTGAAALASHGSGLKALTRLVLSMTRVGDAGAAALAAKDSGLKSLTTLELGNTKITDAGAAVLAARNSGLSSLTTLDLSRTRVGDAGAAALATKDSCLKSLITLDLGGTQVGDAGAAALAANGSGLKSLTTLKLNRTQVTNAGAAALVAKDSGLSALTTLDLNATKVTSEGVTAIRKAHPNLKVIY